MAKATAELVTSEEETVQYNFAPMEGGNAILAAWRGLYWLFGARASKFNVTTDGVFVDNLTVDPEYDVMTIVRDIGGTKNRNRRLELIPPMLWAQGEEPEPFSDAGEMTAWLVANFKGSVDETSTKSPAYARKAVADYKKAHNLYKARGPKRKVIRLDNLKEIDESILSNIDLDDLKALQALFASVAEKKEHQPA
jgi:hypothetical protein